MRISAFLIAAAFALTSCTPSEPWEIGESYVLAGNFCKSKDSAETILNIYQDKGYDAAKVVAHDLREKKTNGDQPDCFYADGIKAVLLQYFRTVPNLLRPGSEKKISVYLFKVRGTCGEYFTLSVEDFEKRR